MRRNPHLGSAADASPLPSLARPRGLPASRRLARPTPHVAPRPLRRGVAWRRPVPGAVARPFAYGANPFRAGWHRGVGPRRAAGRGRARGVLGRRRHRPRRGVVTLRCGRWRVTHLPLALARRRGRRVACARAASSARVGASRRAPRACTSASAARATASPTWTRSRSSPAAPPRRPPSRRRARPASRAPARAALARAARAARAPRRRRAGARRRALAPPRRARPRVRAAPAAVRVSSPAAAGGLAPWPAWVGLALLAARRGRRRGADARAARVALGAAGAGTVGAMIAALLIGFGLGASVAAQLGPMSLLTIRSTLRNGVCGRAGDRRGHRGHRHAVRRGGGRRGGGAADVRARAGGGGRGRRGGARLPRREDAVQRVPDPARRRDRRGAGDAEAGVRRRARRDRLEPAHDRVVGGGVRGGLDGRRDRGLRGPDAARRASGWAA